MSDLTVLLDGKSLNVRMESTTLRVERPGTRPQRIPLNLIGRVVVTGNPLVACGVWRALAEKNVPAVLLPARGRGEPAWIGAGPSGRVTLRMRQYRAALDEDRTLEIARRLVRQKIEGQQKWMADRDENAAPAGDREVLERCRRDLATAETRERLMGLEGAAAAAYFRTVSAALPPRWNFSGRNRRPPRDPVNSLLSLTYVLAGSEISRILRDRGLDPFVGFLHGLQDGRESLMLDVLEPLRPMLDRFVFSLLDSTVTPEDFTRSPRDGCRLRRDGRTRFYGAWADGEGVPALKTAGEAVADAVLDRC